MVSSAGVQTHNLKLKQFFSNASKSKRNSDLILLNAVITGRGFEPPRRDYYLDQIMGKNCWKLLPGNVE